MDVTPLEVQLRDKTVSAKTLLKQDIIPIEFYGKGEENLSLQVDYQTFRRLFKKTGMNTIIELKVEGKDGFDVLVHDIDFDPVTDQITHVDMINIRKGQEIHTKLPLEFVGTSLAVKDLGGTFTTHVDELEIKCLPRDLIHKIEVDISSLEDFTAFIRVKDLKVPETITVLNEPEDVVATVVPPRKEEELESETEEGEEGAEGAEATEEGGEKAEGGEQKEESEAKED